MMNGVNGGMGAGGWLFMSLFWVLLLVVIVWAAAQLFPSRRGTVATAAGPAVEPPTERPQQILDRRLASGEIDVATYEQLRETLAKTGRVS
jgi:putative membrane protein